MNDPPSCEVGRILCLCSAIGKVDSSEFVRAWNWHRKSAMPEVGVVSIEHADTMKSRSLIAKPEANTRPERDRRTRRGDVFERALKPARRARKFPDQARV